MRVDASLRTGKHIGLKGEPYLHRSLQPLDRVDLRNVEDRGQEVIAGAVLRRDPFERDCLGMCGV